LRSLLSQGVADFIVDLRIKDESHINCVSVCRRKLCFNGSVCRDGQGVGNVFISPNNVVYETSVPLEYLIDIVLTI
jgi:hypothetical protein